MYVLPVTSIRPASPVKRKAKSAKTAEVAEAADSKTRKAGKVQARAPRNNRQAAPKPPEAMSSPGVQAALTFLKSGG